MRLQNDLKNRFHRASVDGIEPLYRKNASPLKTPLNEQSSPKNYFVDGDYEISVNEQEIENIYTATHSNYTRNYKIIELDKDVQKKINYKTFDEIIEYYNNYEIHFEKVLHESGINIWFLEHFRLYFNYRNFSIKLKCIKDFLEKGKNSEIISSDKNLLHFIDKSKIQFVKAKKEIGYKRIIKEFIFILSKMKFLKYPTTKYLILTRIIDDINGTDKKLGELERFYDKMMLRNLFDLSEPTSYKKSTSKQLISSDHILLKYLLNPVCIIDLYKFNKVLKQLKRNILNQNNQANEKHKLIFNLFWKRKMSFFVYYARFKSFDKYFKKINISGILLMDENSPQQKVIQYAASRNGIKVFGIQHGAIHDLHPAYIFGKYLNKPLLPDITFTWGKHYSELLIEKGGFSQSQIRTTGRITPLYLEKKINPEIVKNKRIIIYATQPQRDPILREQQLIDVFTVAKQIKNEYQLILRPHPNEKSDEYFLEIARKCQFEDVLIDRQTDLQSHFEICDILITSFSTVGAEFIPYYRPLLVLDYLNQDLIGYIKEGVGIPIKNQAELLNTLTQKQLIINKKSYDEFLMKYFYKTDGEAVERIKKTINEL